LHGIFTFLAGIGCIEYRKGKREGRLNGREASPPPPNYTNPSQAYPAVFSYLPVAIREKCDKIKLTSL
jgi:hypothetical protein